MNPLIALSALCAVLLPQQARADSWAHWRYSQAVKIGAPGAVRVKLGSEALNAAAAHLYDLRITAPDGSELPYMLEIPADETPTVSQPEKFSAKLEKHATVLFIKTDASKPITGLSLETPAREFIKSVDVLWSEDGNAWKPLCSGAPLFRQSNGAENMALAFPQGVYPRLRVTIDDSRSEAIPVTYAFLLVPRISPAGLYPITIRLPEGNRQDSAASYSFQLPSKNLYIEDVELSAAEPVFSRQISLLGFIQESASVSRTIPLASGTVYRFALPEETKNERLRLPVGRMMHDISTLKLEVAEPAGQKLSIPAVTLRLAPVCLKFFPKRSGTYTLRLGNPSAQRPGYDLRGLEQQISGAKFTTVSASGALVRNASYSEPEGAPGVADTGADINVSAWKYRAKVEPSVKGIQALLLTPQVLSDANYPLNDLRLVSDNKQIPYIIAPGSLPCPLDPQVTQLEQKPGRSNYSTWQLVFPYPRLPVSQISFLTPSGVFARKAELYEYAKGDRGEQHRRTLAGATWVGGNDSANGQRRVITMQRPSSDTLYLEINNGDNAPIALSSFTAEYQTRKLLFKSGEPKVIWLYYGNDNATEPDYDIALATQELLLSPSAEVRLLHTEKFKRTFAGDYLGKNSKIALTLVLLLVAGAMIMVIIRLLPPKTQQ